MKIIFLTFFILTSLLANINSKIDKVTLNLNSKNKIQFAGFYIAKEKGFYKDLNLEVEIEHINNDKDYIDTVLNNENHFGLTNSSIFYDRFNNKNLFLLGAILQNSPLVYLSLSNSEITSFNDFSNKKVMTDFNKNEDVLLDVFIHNMSSSKKKLDYIMTSNDIKSLISEEVDILSISKLNEKYFTKDIKNKYNLLDPSKYGYDLYGDILFTSNETYTNNQKKVDSFYKASIKGWEYVFNNIDETIKFFLKINKKNDDYDNYLYQLNILKSLSEFKEGNLGKLNILKIKTLLNLFNSIRNKTQKSTISNIDINSYIYFKSLENITSNKYNLIEESILELIKKPFYNMNEQRMKTIFEDFLKKNYIISLQLHDSFLNRIIFSSWKEKDTIIHRFMDDTEKNFNDKILKIKNIYVNNKKIGYLKIYYNNIPLFTNKEFNYIKQKKELTFCNRNDLAPYTYLENGKYKGIVIDFIKVLEEKLEIKLRTIKTKSWEDCLSLVKNKKIDFSSLIITNQYGYQHLKPTKAYISDHLVLATKIDEPFIFDLNNKKEKLIGVDKRSKNIIYFLKNKHPHIKIKEYENEKIALESIINEDIFGYIGLSAPIAYKIQNQYPYQLKIMTIVNEIKNIGSLGVSQDNDVLLSVLNKVIHSISDKSRREIKNSWIPIKEEHVFNETYILIFTLVVLVLFFGFLYRQILLKKMNKKLIKSVELEVSKNRYKDKLLFQQAKLASMGEMLNNISHQWRQPLNSINSNVAVLDSILVKNKVLDKNLDDNLEDIEKQTKYMSNTIENFRNYFNPKKNKEKFLLSSALEDALSIVKYNFNNLDIKIDVLCNDDLLVDGYLGEYIQTVISILNNSKDALITNNIDNPSIKITINKLLIIDDNAGGIDKKIIDRIFEPYFTTKHKEQGTGIGLYMSKVLIEKSMNGVLSVENYKDGTRIKVKI